MNPTVSLHVFPTHFCDKLQRMHQFYEFYNLYYFYEFYKHYYFYEFHSTNSITSAISL